MSEQDITIMSVQNLPPHKKRSRGRTKLINDLVGLLIETAETGEWKCIPNITKEDKPRWYRKITYAAKVAGKEVESFYVSSDVADGYTPGLYFRGHEIGNAPARGRRRRRRADGR